MHYCLTLFVSIKRRPVATPASEFVAPISHKGSGIRHAVACLQSGLALSYHAAAFEDSGMRDSNSLMVARLAHAIPQLLAAAIPHMADARYCRSLPACLDHCIGSIVRKVLSRIPCGFTLASIETEPVGLEPTT